MEVNNNILFTTVFVICFRWIDISNVINHKKDFTIESNGTSLIKAEFHFSDTESAKNAWRFCVLQHLFYREYEMEEGVDRVDKGMPNFQQAQADVSNINYFI